MRKGPRSLRAQLLGAFLSVALLPASALGGPVAWNALRAARLSTLDHSGQLAAALAAEITQHLEGHLLLLSHREVVALCVFDLVMPGLNGREASDRVRRLRPGVPVLLVSGYGGDALDGAGPSEEAPELLGKPIVPALFLAKVRELLDRAAGEARAARQGL